MKPHPKNVPGDFYVVKNCCTMCTVPFVVAKKLFGVVKEEYGEHCFVQKQPATSKELDQMIEAISCAELACIRYKGRDPKLLERLRKEGQADQCDHLV